MSIREAKSSITNSEIKHLSQDLKILEVERSDRVKNAKGERSIKTLIKIYLIAYIKIKLRKPTDIIVLIIPSMENIVDEFSSNFIIELEILIRLEKQISQPKKVSPNFFYCRRNISINIKNLLT